MSVPATTPRNKQLDGLRIFPVAATMMHHWLGDWGTTLSFGGYHLMFVLSGFLVTRMLFKGRESVAKGKSVWEAIRQFYLRRYLRTLPTYYLVIIAAAIVGVSQTDKIFWWLMTMTPNIYIALTSEWIDKFSHLWSLAVQEQFYLVWAWLVILAPKRWVLPLVGLTVLMGPLFRIYAIETGMHKLAIKCLPFSSLDTLGLGALLAVLIELKSASFNLRAVSRILFASGVAAALGLHYWLALHETSQMHAVFFKTAIALAGCGVIGNIVAGMRGPLAALLEWGPCVYLGRITYGLYLYHFFVPPLLRTTFNAFGLPFDHQHHLSHLLLCFAVLLLIAALSWHFIEQPIARLKERLSASDRAVSVIPEIKSELAG